MSKGYPSPRDGSCFHMQCPFPCTGSLRVTVEGIKFAFLVVWRLKEEGRESRARHAVATLHSATAQTSQKSARSSRSSNSYSVPPTPYFRFSATRPFSTAYLLRLGIYLPRAIAFHTSSPIHGDKAISTRVAQPRQSSTREAL